MSSSVAIAPTCVDSRAGSASPPQARLPSLPSYNKGCEAAGGAGFPVQTFADLLDYIEGRSDWAGAKRAELKTAVRQIAWSISLVHARKSGYPVDRKKLKFSQLAFDVPAINRALEGVNYRLAGFTTDKTYRNAKWGLRQVGRELGRVVPIQIQELPADTPYAPFLSTASGRYGQAFARLFVARLHQQGRNPHDVTGVDLAEHKTFLQTRKLGVKVDATARRLVSFWHKTAERDPAWPQTPLTLPACGSAKPNYPPISAYPVAVQEEMEAVRRWMEGSIALGLGSNDRRGPFSHHFVRRPLRPATIKHHLGYIRRALGVLVDLGTDPQLIGSLRHLLDARTAQAILQAYWDRAQLAYKQSSDCERDYNPTGNTAHTEAMGQTLLMLATHCFPQPPDVVKTLKSLAKAVRRTRRSEMSKKNRKRLDQFNDPVTLSRLLNLANTMMKEALAMRADDLASAARHARTAIFFAIECRIPLRIKNLQSCRLGHNLRFSSADSEVVTLGFQAYETKNWNEIEFYVGPRLCSLLKTYIEHFLPFFASASPDFSDSKWLFPAGDGKEGPLSVNQVRKVITDTVAERVGAIFHPHLFRALAVRLCLEHSPGALEHCRQLLGDKSLEVILAYYAPIRRKEASEYIDRLVDAEEDRLVALDRHATARRRRRNLQP